MHSRNRRSRLLPSCSSVEFVTRFCIVCAVFTLVASQSFYTHGRYGKRGAQHFLAGSRYGRSASVIRNAYKPQRRFDWTDPYFTVNGRYGKRSLYSPFPADIETLADLLNRMKGARPVANAARSDRKANEGNRVGKRGGPRPYGSI